MNKFLFKYGPLSLIIVLLLYLLFSSANLVVIQRKKINDAYNNNLEKCQTIYYEQHESYCNQVMNEKIVKRDTLTTMFDIIFEGKILDLSIFGIIIVIFPAIYNFSKKLKSGFFKNELMRLEYKKYIKKSILKTYKYALIFPIFMIFLFIVSYFISGNFNLEETLKNAPGTFFIGDDNMRNMPIFLPLFIINFLFISVFWINISLIVLKKAKNYISTLLISFLVFLSFELLIEILIGQLLPLILPKFKNLYLYFALFNIWDYKDVNNLFMKSLIIFIYMLISIFIVKKIYKNKEEVILYNE